MVRWGIQKRTFSQINDLLTLISFRFHECLNVSECLLCFVISWTIYHNCFCLWVWPTSNIVSGNSSFYCGSPSTGSLSSLCASWNVALFLWPKWSLAIWSVAVWLKNGCWEVLEPGTDFGALAVMRLRRNHQRKNDRWRCLLFNSNYVVYLSGIINYCDQI